MPVIHEIDPDRPQSTEAAIAAAARAVALGELVVFPTETVYGLGARPDDATATRRLFEAKRRPAGLSLPVLAASTTVAMGLTRPTRAAEALASRFWPGPLTLVLRRSEGSARWYLGEESGSIAVRVPGYPVTLALLRRTGPLAATSANISGRPPLVEPDALVETFGDSVSAYLVLAAGRRPPAQRASTVVDLTGRAPRILREGPIGGEALKRAVGVRARRTG